MTSESNISVRPANLEDVPAILRLERESPTAAQWTPQQYQQAIQSGGAPFGRVVLVVQSISNNGISSTLGFLVARHLAPEWELENIAVAPSARRQGIGKTLLQALVTYARNAGGDSIFLEVRESNASARSLYEASGFRQTGVRKSYYANPLENAIVYRLSLS